MKRTLAILFGLCLCAACATAVDAAVVRPNFLWITCEDLSPGMIGCFGNPQATTPNIDRLAARGTRYLRAFTAAPACSPSRSGIILGTYANSTGSQNLRSQYGLPEQFHGFPSYLRQAGYYCTNNLKTDYNTAEEKRTIAESWDECSGKAHWRMRRPGQPFFAVFNILCTHQSQGGFINPDDWDRPLQPGMHDPAKMPVPPFFPDTPTVRRTLANYHDKATQMDQVVGRILADLEADGLAQDTIVFFYPDHGTGLPRGKRTIYDLGLQVPLVVCVPPNFAARESLAAGATVDRLVSFVDFGPTLLSLVGLPAPAQMQGHAFLGPHAQAPRQYVYGARDRVDEAFDMARSVRDGRFLYIRHFYPHLSWNAPECFSDKAPMRREIAQLARAGKLNAAQLTYAGPCKPVEELFDTDADPHQIHNLAADPMRHSVLERMQAELRRWLLEIRDTGFMPEEHMEQATLAGSTPWDLAHDDAAYPLATILEVAQRVGDPAAVPRQVEWLRDRVPAVRFWAVQGLAAAGESARSALPQLRAALADADPAVRVVAAGAVLNLTADTKALGVLTTELQSKTLASVRAARTLELVGEKARPAIAAMRTALGDRPGVYITFALSEALKGLGEDPSSLKPDPR